MNRDRLIHRVVQLRFRLENFFFAYLVLSSSNPWGLLFNFCCVAVRVMVGIVLETACADVIVWKRVDRWPTARFSE